MPFEDDNMDHDLFCDANGADVLSDQAEKMAKKADAWKEYKEAAMVDMMLQTLPKVIIYE